RAASSILSAREPVRRTLCGGSVCRASEAGSRRHAVYVTVESRGCVGEDAADVAVSGARGRPWRMGSQGGAAGRGAERRRQGGSGSRGGPREHCTAKQECSAIPWRPGAALRPAWRRGRRVRGGLGPIAVTCSRGGGYQ